MPNETLGSRGESAFPQPGPVPLRRSLLLLLLSCAVGLAAWVGPLSAQAATGEILVVTDRPDLEQGSANIAGYLRSLGYDVTTESGTSATGPSNYRVLDAAKISYMETFDLVVVLRTLNSGDFANGSEAIQWNSLNVPLLLGSAYLARNNPARWNWLVGSQTRATVTGLTFVNPTHPIVNGLSTDLFNLPVDVDYVTATTPGNGTLVAGVNNAGVAIAVWEGSGFFIGVTGGSHVQRRVFFPTMRYYETDLSVYPGVFSDYSPNGLQLLANAVAYAMDGTVSAAPSVVNLTPADGTVSHPAASGLSFGVTSTEAIADAGIRLELNGVDVSGQLVLGGGPTQRTAAFGGLSSETAYAGTITVTNGLGSRTVNFSFDTFAPDVTAPVLTGVSPMAGEVTELVSITVTFSEPVAGVTASDLLVNAGPASTVSGSGSVYTFGFDAPLYGVVNVGWDPSAQIRDLAPGQNLFDPAGPGTAWQYDYRDVIGPVVTETSPFPGAAIRSLTQVSVTFSEAVTGVDASDLELEGVGALSVSGTLAGPYLFGFAEPPPGMVGLAWVGGHGIADTAVPANVFVGDPWSYDLEPALPLPDVRLNEILAATLDVDQFKDGDGELQDWVEIFNHGSEAVNLAGWSLTDDLDDPDRWVFPGVTLGAGQYLVVFASGKDRKAGALHANFQLSSAGEFLGLYNADLPPALVSVLEYPEQRNDIAYGYDPADELRYFSVPTPGVANGQSTLEGVVPPVQFNVGRGLFDTPFTLHLSGAEPGAEIRYTTDGSEPSLGNGSTYEGPVQVAGTTILRAAAFKANRLPSVVTTHTYLFLEDALTQPAMPPGFPPTWGTASSGFPTPDVPADYEMDPEIVEDPAYAPDMLAAMRSLPSVSIVMSEDALFGPQNGIYSHVTENQSLYRGLAWERACSMEFLTTNGQGGFQVDCGIRMQGNASREPRKNPKHPFRLLFRGAYGPGQLEESVFPDSPATRFNSLVMRADFNNAWLHWDANQRLRGTRIRDAWVKDTWREMGHPGSHTRYFHLFLNGLYWGIYDFGERIDAAFAANYMGGEREDYDAIASKPVKAVDGDTVAYSAMRTVVTGRDQTVLANYQSVLELLDMESFVDYMLLNFYGGNQDWGDDSNWNMVRRRSPAGKFKMAAWDGEQLLVAVGDNRVSNTSVPGGLHNSLRNSPEYRMSFADRAHRHLFNGGALTVESATGRWLGRADEVRLAMLAEAARWGDYRRDVHQHSAGPYLFYTPNGFWQPEIDRITTSYFPQRHGIFLAQLRAAGLYPSIDAPAFSQQGGVVPSGFSLTITSSNPVYYTTDGSDPREFGTGNIAPGAILYAGPIPLVASAGVRARARSGAVWSAINEAEFTVVELTLPIRITEIMYNPIGGDPYEFIELQNMGGRPVGLGEFVLSGVTFGFPTEAELAPGQTIVLASGSSPAAFAGRYPGVVVYGYFSGNLSNGGERLALQDPAGRNITSVEYSDSGGWPVRADGFGASLELIAPGGDLNDPASWQASVGANGSPGVTEAPPAAPSVRLNEVMAENLGTIEQGGLFPDWIELRNVLGTDASLDGWSLSDSGDPRRFVFPNGTVVPAGGYLIVWCDTNTAAAGVHTGFGLNREGESLFLYDAATNRVDGVGFGNQVADFTVGRVGDEWVLCDPTPGAVNQAAAGLGAGLWINEWMADSAPGGEDWLELYNPGGVPVALRGLYLGNGLTTFRIDSLSFVAPNGFLRLWADENPGPDHLDFRLPASGGTITLHGRDSLILDSVVYGPQMEAVSEGRLPDGGMTIVAFPVTPSPGAANHAGTYSGPGLNEVLARNVSVEAGPGAVYADWIELRQDSGLPADVSGLRLSDDRSRPDKWIVPSGVQMNGYLRIWCDGNRPASASAEADLNTGFSLSGEGGGVYLFDTGGRLVDLVEYGPQVRDLSIGLVGGEWRLAGAPTPGAANASAASLGVAGGLRINEWMAGSVGEADWLELYNPDDLPVDLDGLVVTDDVSLRGPLDPPLPSLSFIGARGHVRLYAGGSASGGPDHLAFSLEGSGEALRIHDRDGLAIDSVFFGAQVEGVSEGRLPDGDARRVRFETTPTPAAGNYLPLPDLSVSEVLTHTDDPLEDAVELWNAGGAAVDVGGWYLSDWEGDLKKYRIPAGTVLAAGGFGVFYQNQLDGGVGSVTPFTFDSSRGDAAILSEADGAGELTGYRSVAVFGAAVNGVSFGRYETSLGPRYPALVQRTFGVEQPADLAQFRTGTGLANAGPAVGPVIFNELMYHPAAGGGEEGEYIELHNLSPVAVALHDGVHPENRWQIRGGVSYDFPGGVEIPGRAYLLVVGFDPGDVAAAGAFRAAHGLPPGVLLYGPYEGRLGNDGDRVQLLKPDAPQGPGPEAGFVPRVLVDEVGYDDLSPWPEGADGLGESLQRRRPWEYGDDPVNWKSAPPTAGRANVDGVGFEDLDGDGLPDDYEIALGLEPNDPADAVLDPDLDGASSLREFHEGTHPLNAASVLVRPVIVQQPADRTAEPNQFVTLTASAGGSLPLEYQWLRNGRPLPGANAPALELAFVDTEDGGLYTLVVRNAAGFAVSLPAGLTVNLPPRITQQPVGGELLDSGSEFVLAVGAAGTGVLRYQWLHNGLPRAGADDPVLILSNLQARDSGEYAVRVMDDISSVLSETVVVSVDAGPAVLVPPFSQTVAVGDTVTFSVWCDGTLPMYYRWRRGGATLALNSGFRWVDYHTITNVQLSHAGNYSVILTNRAFYTPGIATMPAAVLTVLVDTDMDGLPDTVEMAEGTNPNDPADGLLDRDGDGVSNRDEFRSGTDLNDPMSYLRVDAVEVNGVVTIRFRAVAGRTYSVIYQDGIGTPWFRLQDVPAPVVDQEMEVVDPAPPVAAERFYRLLTPRAAP